MHPELNTDAMSRLDLPVAGRCHQNAECLGESECDQVGTITNCERIQNRKL